MECRLIEILDGRSITWLAKKSNVSRNTIHNYLKGAIPTLEKAYCIAKALDVTVYEIWPPK